MRYLLVILAAFWIGGLSPRATAGEIPPPLPSLQSYTGLWDMPTARILPDWNVRFKYGKAEPFRYYGVALGLFDRLEIHGQFTENSNLFPFKDQGYGYHKDRNAGARLVLTREDEFFPQTAIGIYDPIGTSLFPSRYLVLSKGMHKFDLTLGAGQGLMGGESLDDISRKRKGETFDTTFLFSRLGRKTRLFGGLEYHHRPDLTFSAEYSSFKYEGMHGSPDKARWPVNLGLKYKVGKHLYLQGGYMRGEEWSIGLSLDLPLEPEGLLPWTKEAPYSTTEKNKWQAHAADNRDLAELLATELKGDGFLNVTASVNDREIYIEFINAKYLSHAKAFGRVAKVLDTLAPERIETFYLNLMSQGQVIQSMKSTREELRAFMTRKTDKNSFLKFTELSQYNASQKKDFFTPEKNIGSYHFQDDRLNWDMNLKIKTLLNDPSGFFRHKIFLQPRASISPWKNGLLIGELEFTLLNEWDEVPYDNLEPDPARTDFILYERESRARVSTLAYDQHLNLPYHVLGRFSAGIFESAYAGVGGEVFRYFKDGRLGLGLEGEFVRKRDTANNFKLHDEISKTYETYYLNLYGQLWPSLGLEAGLKIGQFLAGDFGVRTELRRSFKYFTIGAWYTHTDTDHLVSELNRGNNEKGVFIRIPLSLFKDRDQRGSLQYAFTSFTRDPGQSVRQPSQLYPMDPYRSVNHTRAHLEDMTR
ncbi:MAG: YjbH domain-containing protein [Proteobacteria bacterium]|nr:YjbH domain-containing protein [Pseudomonadota bacterium]MBU1738856.1 YjbH domain-containing protein [Pseudomonadota bacterium]